MPKRALPCAVVVSGIAAILGSPALAIASAPATSGVSRVSVTSQGAQLAGQSSGIRLSGNGRYALFTSNSSALVPGDTNGVDDAFVRDQQSGHVERISVTTKGLQAKRASQGISISDDGRYVVFDSQATLDPHDTDDRQPPDIITKDVYLRDRVAGTTTLITDDPIDNYGDGGQISGNGRYVAYYSGGINYRWDRLTGQTVDCYGITLGHDSYYQGISANGRFIGVQGFNYDVTTNVSLWDVQQDTMTGIQLPVTLAHPTWGFSIGGLTPDGKFLVLLVGRPNQVLGGEDVYVYNVQTHQAKLVVSVSDRHSISARSLAVSPDGARVAFATSAQLVPADTDHVTDIYEWSTAHGLRRVSAPVVATGGRAQTFAPSYSADGSKLAFTSAASDLIAHDTNSSLDVFTAPTN